MSHAISRPPAREISVPKIVGVFNSLPMLDSAMRGNARVGNRVLHGCTMEAFGSDTRVVAPPSRAPASSSHATWCSVNPKGRDAWLSPLEGQFAMPPGPDARSRHRSCHMEWGASETLLGQKRLGRERPQARARWPPSTRSKAKCRLEGVCVCVGAVRGVVVGPGWRPVRRVTCEPLGAGPGPPQGRGSPAVALLVAWPTRGKAQGRGDVEGVQL